MGPDRRRILLLSRGGDLAWGTFKWQRLGDLVAATVVVRDKKRDFIVRSLSLTQE